jgi:exo-beta-1,3-glucanase (GH17 family)
LIGPSGSTSGTIGDEGTIMTKGIVHLRRILVGADYWSGFSASSFLSRDLPFLKEANINIIRLEFGPSSESNLATLVPTVRQNGIEVLGLLMRKDLISDVNAWGTWVNNTVSNFKDKIKVWEIWNEPNWNTGFGAPGDPIKYMEFLKEAYINAKQADPDCVVLGSSILATDNAGQNWLRSMYDNGAKDYMDAVAVHPYCSSLSPLYPSVTGSGKAFWKLQSMRDIMIQYGDANKSIWITEMGWPTGGSGGVVTEAEQALYLSQALNLSESWDWLETFIIYQWMDGGGFYYGLVREQYNPPYTEETFCKPSFSAVRDFR